MYLNEDLNPQAKGVAGCRDSNDVTKRITS